MENPVDHTLDLGLVNYVQHPSDPGYIVFRFADPKRAEAFENELLAQGIWYEKDESEKRGTPFYLFGIHKNDYKKVEKINYKVEGQHKKPLIPGKYFRYGLMLFSFTLLTLAIIGYCKKQETLQLHNEVNSTVNETISH